MGEVYLSGVYTPPLVRQTARMGRHCRYWVSESNTPYASTDASIGGSAGFWERWSGRRMQLSSGSQAVGHGVRTGCSAAWCPGPGRGQDIGIKCATYGSLTLSRAGRRWQRGQVEEDGLAGRAGRVQVVRGGVGRLESCWMEAAVHCGVRGLGISRSPPALHFALGNCPAPRQDTADLRA
jgi:hypothetical protein